ncbi:hypothetical protein [Limnospira sp. Paracas R14]|uniref:hypothetical protein n=1 Tax=Limnospira sp. Paracas R14 TaxID=2981108 RepID=UPI0028E0DC03|nr:hypothetical protein [Limnospira sp. Paracas R14]
MIYLRFDEGDFIRYCQYHGENEFSAESLGYIYRWYERENDGINVAVGYVRVMMHQHWREVSSVQKFIEDYGQTGCVSEQFNCVDKARHLGWVVYVLLNRRVLIRQPGAPTLAEEYPQSYNEF